MVLAKVLSDDPGDRFHRWPSKGHLRSPKVTNRFLRITFDPKEIETWEWSHCVSLIKTHRYICNMTYLGHHVTLNWGQILTLTFQGHAIHVSMRLGEANTMVSTSLLYPFKHESYHRKTGSLKNAVFDLSWPLTPKPLDLGEIWRHSSERAFQELSIAFFKFWCSCYRDRDNAHNMKPCHVIRKFGKILPLMTSGDLNFDLT